MQPQTGITKPILERYISELFICYFFGREIIYVQAGVWSILHTNDTTDRRELSEANRAAAGPVLGLHSASPFKLQTTQKT